VNFRFLYSTVSTLKPIVGSIVMNSFCFSLNKIEVFPAPSKPNVTTRISIFGPICTRLSFVKVIGMLGSGCSCSGVSSEYCCCCFSIELKVSLISLAAAKTRVSSCCMVCSHWTQTPATCESDVAKSSCSCRSEQSLSRIYVSTAVMAAASCSCSVSSSCWKYV